MKTMVRAYLAISILTLFSFTVYGETTIYTTNFGTTSGTFPSGWSTATTGTGTWIITSTSASSTYPGYSASMNATATNQTSPAPTGTATLLCNPGISTVGYTNITVIWGARRTSTFTNAVSFEWSTDGSSWTPVTFTEVTNNGTWALVNGGTRIVLPAGAEGAANLQFRRVYSQITGSGTYRMDDFNVQGTASGPIITVTTTGFSGTFPFTKVGNSSVTSSFSVSAISLTGDLTITPPTGFEIRTGSNAFSAGPVTLTQSGGVVATTTIDARFTPLAYVKYSGSIACSSTGAGTQYVSVSGTGGIRSVAAGNWSAGSTWDGGVVPTSEENVYISSSFPVTIDDGTAECNSIDFDPDGTAGLLVMGSATSVLSVYGDFTLGNTTQMVFSSSWPAGAKIKFTGPAAVQTLRGWNTSSTNSGGFMEVQVDKSDGKVTTSTLNMKLTIGTSLEIVNGTFEMGASDDLYGRDLAGTATTPTIVIQSGGTFTIATGATQINSGNTNPSSAYNPIGRMTVYGTAELVTTSTSKLNIGGITVENGGTLRLLTGWGGAYLAAGVDTIKNGGTLRYSSTSSAIWETANSTVVVNAGGIVNVTATSAITLPVNFTDNGATFKYSYTDQTGILARTYTNLELSGSGSKTLAGAITVNGTLAIFGSASLALGSGSLTYGASSTLQYGTSGQVTPQVTSDIEWPETGGPLNVRIYNSGGVTLHATRTVNGTLTMSNGLFMLGDNNLVLGTAATISGTTSATKMIVTNGSGSLVKLLDDATSLPYTFTFPIGDNTVTNDYSPVSVSITAGSLASAAINAKVINAKHTANGSGTDYLNRYWTLSSTGITGLAGNVTATYVLADVNGTEANLYGGLYNGSVWSSLGGVNAGTHQIVATGLTGFGDISAGEISFMNPVITALITLIPEGYFSGSGNLSRTDTLKAYLANTTTFADADSAAIIIDPANYTGTATFSHAPGGTYYLYIKGSAVVQTWSGAGIVFNSGSPTNYDFTTAATQAYSSNMIQKGSKWCLYSGDVDQSLFIDNNDLLLIDNDAFKFVSGYVKTDLDGTLYVDNNDLLICDNNAYKFIGAKTPRIVARPVKVITAPVLQVQE